MPLVKGRNLKSVKALVYFRENTAYIYVEKQKNNKIFLQSQDTKWCLLGIIGHVRNDFRVLRCLHALFYVKKETAH